MSGIAIKVENLSKLYRLGEIGTGTIRNDLKRWWAQVRDKEDPFAKIGQVNDRTQKVTNDYVWALKDIDFEVKKGEVLGIIGHNGAGKSTLLKILSKITSPTTGKIKIDGRIASLLEVGTGFHPELSGRDNIFMNGAILGMRKWEIQKKLDEIVNFSGVEAYIDTPVKRYSSGMYVRLAFAVAAHLEPEILIIDEVLAVGDFEFQKKCLQKMNDVSINEGRTVLFVSHNLTALQTLCTKSILLKNGKTIYNGITSDVIAEYNKSGTNFQTSWKGEDGDGYLIILSTKVYQQESDFEFYKDRSTFISLHVHVKQYISSVVIGFNLFSSFGYPVFRAGFNDFNDYNDLQPAIYEVIFEVPAYHLATGTYNVRFDIAIPFRNKINSSIIDLSFDLLARNNIGNKFMVSNSPEYNSLILFNAFRELKKISNE